MNVYRIVVSEPWNFTSKSGDNLITGKVLKLLSKNSLIFITDYLLEFGDISGRVLILSPRYDNEIFDENEGLENTVAGGIVLCDNYQVINEAEIIKNSRYVLTGRLERY